MAMPAALVLPTPMAAASATTSAWMIESLSAPSVTSPSVAVTVLPPVMAALARLRMLLSATAPPPLMARPVCDDAATDRLAAAVIVWISASSEAVKAILPVSAVTVD